jgi:hypothetical protein
MAVMPIWVVNPSKREVAEAPWAARCGVLSRVDSAAIDAPCVLASHHPGHLDDGRSPS